MSEENQKTTRKWRNASAAELLADIPEHSSIYSSDAPKLQDQLVKITDGVYAAVDYGFANCVFLEGPEKIIVIDTTESSNTSTKIMRDFRKICTKPIAAIVYTDHHGDHSQGIDAFLEDPENPPDIWAHISQKKQIHQVLLTGPRILRGNVYQFGLAIGSGDSSEDNQKFHKGMLNPVKIRKANKYVNKDVEEVEIAGVKLTFIYMPGEADDVMAIWMPDKRVLLPGDNFYPAFPNIYSLRGVAPRDARDWYQSVAKLRQLKAQYFVPAHEHPIVGEDEIHEVLTVYMSALQYVHDQTMRYLNHGLHPDDIASKIKLPPVFKDCPYLSQSYGSLEWSIKGIYDQQVGWFQEDIQQLNPHTPAERSKRMVEMVGKEQLLSQAVTALNKSDPQWALELSTYVFTEDPENTEAKDVRTEALRALAGLQTNPVARNFYLTEILNDHKLIDWKKLSGNPFTNKDILEVFSLLKIMLKAELIEGKTVTVLFTLLDDGEIYKLQIRYSILSADIISKEEISKLGSSVDVHVTATCEQWKRVLVENLESESQLKKEGLKIEGSLEKLKEFISYFEL